MLTLPGQTEPSVVALLGPTNTGKTHRALERLQEHQSGIIGLPLRLLAREVYDRLTAIVGEGPVALLTGEEKRVGTMPRYWICTVEAMPLDHSVDFLAVDEIQLCAHPQRGHVFTQRLLSARGRLETWFMGADTMRPIVQTLLPDARIVRYPRLSQLRSRGQGTLGAIPRRSALVAFSVPSVVGLAERVRRRRGGTAVVMGALSPRARNAQVALYQSGEVDYMVATDAIGMGLNLDLDHVAFAESRKFDGREERPLDAAELAQIAGRAGRYHNDGSFGTLAPARALARRVTQAIEGHRFPAVRQLMWRNAELDFSTLDSLLDGLRQRPPSSLFKLAARADDHAALRHLAQLPAVRGRVAHRQDVECLWEVCQIPDYRQLTFDVHLRLLEELYHQLSSRRGWLDPEWVRLRVRQLDDPRGDIDSLTLRMAGIRTWTYVAHRGDWLPNASEWQERTREIEDRLSDALHERLVERFVDRERRIQRGPAETDPRKAEADSRDFFAQLWQLRQAMQPHASVTGGQDQSIVEIIEAPHSDFEVDAGGRITHRGRLLGMLTAGVDRIHPGVTLANSETWGAGARQRVLRRLVAYTHDLVTSTLGPLRHSETADLSPPGRGLLYQLQKGLGTLHAASARQQLQSLTRTDRALLSRLGIRLGQKMVFVPSLLTSPAVLQRVALCSVSLPPGVDLEPPPEDAPSMAPRPSLGRAIHTAIGYPVFGPLALRADIAEQVHGLLRRVARRGTFECPRELPAVLASTPATSLRLVQAFGYRPIGDGRFVRARRRPFRSGEPRAPQQG